MFATSKKVFYTKLVKAGDYIHTNCIGRYDKNALHS